MKDFLINILKLSLLCVLLLGISLLWLPDKTTANSLLGALPDKHDALGKMKRPKILLVGGSNVSFGINSELLEKQFHKPVFNTAIHAGLGMQFILEDCKPYIQAGDTVIIMPEYENFYTDNFYGEMELVSVLFSVVPDGKKTVSPNQWRHLMQYMPVYAAKKIKNLIPDLLRKKSADNDIYSRHSFNAYGDCYLHWDMPRMDYLPCKAVTGKETLNDEAFECLKSFREYVLKQKATLYIFPPAIDFSSFKNISANITRIEERLKNEGLGFTSEAKNYTYPDSLFFNSYYHLGKKGADNRTARLINDICTKRAQ